jgi:uracil-DNA glycosylase
MGSEKTALLRLQDTIIQCLKCPRLVTYRQEVARHKVRRFRSASYWGLPVPSFGDPLARLLVIGLAPAAHGGNRTGRAFTGDQSGAWLYEALYSHGFANQPNSTHCDDGLTLHDCYITQVLHCAPPANKPIRQEIEACQPYMLTELQLLTNLRVCVALGRIAFDACLRVYRQLGISLPSPLPCFGHGLLYNIQSNLTLIASYHPSQQNTYTGRLTRPMFHRIFTMAREVLSP